MTNEAIHHVIAIKLKPELWEKRQEWLNQAEKRRKRDQSQAMRRQAFFADIDNTVVVPATNLWVVQGAVEYGEFTFEEEQDDYPDEAIRRQNQPVPVIAWRVSRFQVDDFDAGSEPEMVIFDGEYPRTITDMAFGNTPEEAVAQARRLLVADREERREQGLRCAAAHHRKASIYQEGSATCDCRTRHVEFIQASSNDD
uniref:hypothetical protein n=1 Tax=Paractinoplanes polyasparticus TaxID=2856853 RepID=UPI001C843559|nr:hypothetical protein [Actinoplanes polyasparticus]